MSVFTDKIKSFFGIKNELNQGFFEDLQDLLVEGDFGASLAIETSDLLESACKKKGITTREDAKKLLFSMLKEYLIKGKKNNNLFDDKKLNVIMLLGVNGVGKTTTAAKLAHLFKNKYKVLLAAADTFRAAAIDQLIIHGENLSVRVVAHKQHGDPAAVVYDALEAARAGNYDFVIADTAGRMHTKAALVDELKKVDRVVERFQMQNDINYLKYLVLDATTGSNAMFQAETFNEAVNLDGVILTKADSSAKGGVVFALASKLALPVLYVCNGEKYENLQQFNADDYIEDFLGSSTV